MSTPKLPWEPGWVPPALDTTVQSVITDVTQAAGQAAGTVVSDATQAVEAAVPTVPAIVTGTVPSVSVPTLPVAGMVTSLEEAAEKAVVSALQKIAVGTPQVPSLDDFIHADARSRAFRTLLSGLGLTVLTAIIGALGMASGLNWFDSHTWPALLTIFSTSIIGAVSAYIGRLVKEPAHTAPLTNLLAVAGTKT